MHIIPKARNVVNMGLALALVFSSNAATAGVKLVLRHPQGDKHNQITQHTRVGLRNYPLAVLPRKKGIMVYAMNGATPVVVRDGVRVLSVTAVKMHIGATTPTLVVRATLRPRIRTIDFESGEIP